jgi:hypothetical protein
MKRNLWVSINWYVPLFIVLSTLAIFGIPSNTFAQVCIPGIGCMGGTGVIDVTLKSFNVYFINNSGHSINACARWYQSQQNFALPGGGSTNWDNGCWNLAPGETAFVINNATGRNIYFSATATDGSGLIWSEQEVDMGSRYTRFEYTFN